MTKVSLQRGDNLLNPKLTVILFSIAVNKLGGELKITQADIDEVAYHQLLEEGFTNGDLSFTLKLRNKQ